MHLALDARPLALRRACARGKPLDPSLDVGAMLPAGTICCSGKTKLLATDVAALARLTGDRDLAFSAEFQHAALVEAKAVDPKEIARVERNAILDHFGGSRAAYNAALVRAKATPALARLILADELRRAPWRRRCALRPDGSPLQRGTRPTTRRSPGRCARRRRCQLGNAKTGLAIEGVAPGGLLSLAAGAQVTIDGVVGRRRSASRRRSARSRRTGRPGDP